MSDYTTSSENENKERKDVLLNNLRNEVNAQLAKYKNSSVQWIQSATKSSVYITAIISSQ